MDAFGFGILIVLALALLVAGRATVLLFAAVASLVRGAPRRRTGVFLLLFATVAIVQLARLFGSCWNGQELE